jgi:hypothetical protein
MPAPSSVLSNLTHRIWTMEERNVLPDNEHRYEVVDGELLVTPAPSWRHPRGTPELAQAGVPEEWIVDPANRLVERWRPGIDEPEILAESFTWQPREGASPLACRGEAVLRSRPRLEYFRHRARKPRQHLARALVARQLLCHQVRRQLAESVRVARRLDMEELLCGHWQGARFGRV